MRAAFLPIFHKKNTLEEENKKPINLNKTTNWPKNAVQLNQFDVIFIIFLALFIALLANNNASFLFIKEPQAVVSELERLKQISSILSDYSQGDIVFDSKITKDTADPKSRNFHEQANRIQGPVNGGDLAIRHTLLYFEGKIQTRDTTVRSMHLEGVPFGPNVVLDAGKNGLELATGPVVPIPHPKPQILVERQPIEIPLNTIKPGVNPATNVAQTVSPTKREKSISNSIRTQSVAPDINRLIADYKVQTIDRGFQVVVPGVNLFARNSRELAPSAHEILKPIADVASRHDGYELEIVGHTDSFKSGGISRALSLQRARLVRNFLSEAFGIDINRVRFDGKGKDEPIAPNSTLDGRQANRRIEITFVKQP